MAVTVVFTHFASASRACPPQRWFAPAAFHARIVIFIVSSNHIGNVEAATTVAFVGDKQWSVANKNAKLSGLLRKLKQRSPMLQASAPPTAVHTATARAGLGRRCRPSSRPAMRASQEPQMTINSVAGGDGDGESLRASPTSAGQDSALRWAHSAQRCLSLTAKLWQRHRRRRLRMMAPCRFRCQSGTLPPRRAPPPRPRCRHAGPTKAHHEPRKPHIRRTSPSPLR